MSEKNEVNQALNGYIVWTDKDPVAYGQVLVERDGEYIPINISQIRRAGNGLYSILEQGGLQGGAYANDCDQIIGSITVSGFKEVDSATS